MPAEPAHQDGSEYPSGSLIYEIARGRQCDQLAQREAYRTRSGSLLAFAGILATLSIATTSVHGHSLLVGAGVLALIIAAALFFAVIVWFNLKATPRLRPLFEDYAGKHEDHTRFHITGNLIDAVEDNEATLQTTDFIHTLAVLMLFLGTVLVGIRVVLMVV
jgi:hypothetical protein